MSEEKPSRIPVPPADTAAATLLRDPIQDNLATTVIALATEIWVGRRRLAVIEALLENGRAVTAEAIETFVPPAGTEAQWEREREAFVQRVFRSMAAPHDPSLGVAATWREKG